MRLAGIRASLHRCTLESRVADAWPLDGALWFWGREAHILDDGLRSTASCLLAIQGSNWRCIGSWCAMMGGVHVVWGVHDVRGSHFVETTCETNCRCFPCFERLVHVRQSFDCVLRLIQMRYAKFRGISLPIVDV
ncbi:unnamed protein product [Ectocarpus sp. 12 AP-2014]